MPIPTPFHSRTSALCKSHEWRNWSGYLGAISYEPTHDAEYFAIRNSAALIDVSPLFKYEITGPDAARLVDRIVTRDISKCKIEQVVYTPWCDDYGKMIDDGTVQRLDEHHFRVTSATQNLRWFQDCGFGMEVIVTDISAELAALAIQGPNARDILKHVATTQIDLDALKFFYLIEGKIADVPVIISRTGYTGDLGYEVWIPRDHAEPLWDVLMDTGRRNGLLPAGLAALDIARIEAGLILIDVDYISSKTALIEARKSSPFEAGLGWTVKLEKANFVGRKALEREKQHGSEWSLVGLEVEWQQIQHLFDAVGLAPQVAGRSSRLAVPLYANDKHIGQATSTTFSPILKKFISLATVRSEYGMPGTRLDMEFTVEFVRHTVEATVVQPPFFNPERKRSVPDFPAKHAKHSKGT